MIWPEREKRRSLPRASIHTYRQRGFFGGGGGIGFLERLPLHCDGTYNTSPVSEVADLVNGMTSLPDLHRASLEFTIVIGLGAYRVSVAQVIYL